MNFGVVLVYISVVFIFCLFVLSGFGWVRQISGFWKEAKMRVRVLPNLQSKEYGKLAIFSAFIFLESIILLTFQIAKDGPVWVKMMHSLTVAYSLAVGIVSAYQYCKQKNINQPGEN